MLQKTEKSLVHSVVGMNRKRSVLFMYVCALFFLGIVFMCIITVKVAIFFAFFLVPHSGRVYPLKIFVGLEHRY